LPPGFAAQSELAAALAKRAMKRAYGAINAAYDAGKALAEVKAHLPSGRWTEWCEGYRVDRSWSYRLIELYNRWDEIQAARANGGPFTVTTALKIIHGARPKTSVKAKQARSRASSTRRSPSMSPESRSGGIDPDLFKLLTTIRHYLAKRLPEADETQARLIARIDFYLADDDHGDDGRADKQDEAADGEE